VNIDKDIVVQLKRGEEKAYRYIFDTHYILLCHVAAEFLKNDFLAETIVGNVILNLWEKREKIDIQGSLRAYLVQAVRNSCINYLQQNYVRKETSLSNAGKLSSFDNFISDSHPLAILLEKELEEKINRSIESLPEECCIVFKMSRFEKMTYQEIAKKRNISINTVKYHIKNALSKLNADLEKYLTS